MTSAEEQKRRDKRHSMMLEQPVARVIPTVAVPMIVAMLIDAIYNLTDTFFVSQLGTAATAAVGVNDSLMHLMRSVALAFGVGASSTISRLLGGKKDEYASRVASTTLLTAMVVISLLAAVAAILVGPLVLLLGATESVKPYSMQYARWFLLASPFTAGTVVLSQLLRAEGSTRYSMLGMVSGCILNIALDPLFIYGLDLGVAGAAMATGLSKLFSFSVLLVPFLRRRTLLEISLKLFTPKKALFLSVGRIGVPTFLRMSMLTLSSIVINNVAARFSDAALAAISVANKCTRLVGSGIIGLGQGFQPIAGYCWGARHYARIRKAFWTCSAMGACAAAVLGVAMGLLAPRLIYAFTASNDPEIIRLGSTMIISQCITMVPHVWVIIANGLFQALGRPVGTLVLGMSRQAICLIPSVVLLSRLFGVDGLTVSQATSDLLSALVALPMVIYLLRRIRQIELAEIKVRPFQSEPQHARFRTAGVKHDS